MAHPFRLWCTLGLLALVLVAGCRSSGRGRPASPPELGRGWVWTAPPPA